jgi:branched-chain amino acid transport system substrate-binding protein
MFSIAFSRSAVMACLLSFSASTMAADNWVVGQSAPLSGSNGAFGRDIRDGAQAYFKAVNSRGGVGGKPVDLITVDDRNDRVQAGLNTTQLVDNKDVAALFGYASATLSLNAIPQAEKAGMLFFAPFSGANAVRRPSPVLFTARASYSQELDKMLSFWTSMGLKQVVVVFYDDEVGRQNLAVVEAFLSKLGLKPQTLALKRNVDVTPAQVNSMLALKPEVIVNTTSFGPAAEISKQIVAKNLTVPMSSLSFVGAQQYIDAAGPAAAGTSIAQVVPGVSSAIPIVRECAKSLQDAGITTPFNSTHLEACMGAKVLIEAMRKTKKIGDRAALLSTMQSLGAVNLGGYTLNYGGAGATAQHGSSFVDLAMVTREGKLRN